MSLDGLRRSRGSRVTIRRATRVRKPQGDTGVTPFTSVATDVPVLLQELAAGRAQRLFGRETQATGLATFEAGCDVQGDDGLIVTSGPHAGTHWKVLQPRDVEGHHLEYGVQLTKETFA